MFFYKTAMISRVRAHLKRKKRGGASVLTQDFVFPETTAKNFLVWAHLKRTKGGGSSVPIRHFHDAE